MTIYFDMDGTMGDFYSVPNWLEYLISENPLPYAQAKPRFNFSTFARLLHKLQNKGYRLGVLSWLSKSGSDDYNKIVTEVKRKWLAKHLPSVNFDEIIIIPYGTPKKNYAENGDILFDDEEHNRTEWENKGIAFDADNILDILKEILQGG